MRTPLALASLALLAFLSACSSSVVEDGGGGQGGGDTSGSDSTGSGVGCEAYDNQSGPAVVTLRVRNDTGLDVYLPASCDTAQFTIENSPTPDPDVWYGPGGVGACTQTCEMLQEEEPYVCDFGGCPPSSIRIAAGQTRDLQWHGTGARSREMPDICWFTDYPNDTCTQIIAAKSGDYQVSLRGYSECGEECTCDAEGLCTGDAIGLEAYLQPTVFQYPATSVVELVFDVCAFGCAGG